MRVLSGRTALVTGASDGIGPYVVRQLASEGVDLVLVARRLQLLQEVAASVGGARVLEVDLADRSRLAPLVEEVGAIDILVAGAGLQSAGPLDAMGVDEIDAGLEVNLRSAIVLSRLLLPGMLERRCGHIVLLGSMAAKVPGPRASIYNATKFGLRGFGRALREEVRGTGVGVSVINPTFVGEAGMWARGGRKASLMAGEVRPEEVAAAVVAAIRRDRGEVDVAPIQARLGARLLAAAPELGGFAARRSGVADIGHERQAPQKGGEPAPASDSISRSRRRP